MNIAVENEEKARGRYLKLGALAGGLLLAVAAGTIAARWMIASSVQSMHGAGLVAAATPAEPVNRARPSALPADVIHADVYFDLKSTRLRADAVQVLQEQAALMDRAGSWGVLVMGYVDGRGASEYNRALAQRRADGVKQFLVELGVPPASVRTLAVGPDASICDDPGRECQQLNRRVHIEIRKLAQTDSPASPAGADAPETAPADGSAPASGR
ncbi:MAG TPA: OmpA family protein [Candidatus Methylomirabilis sp.]|nr:OmpA family protein [Candidatus Methylomirabilis sp.]